MRATAELSKHFRNAASHALNGRGYTYLLDRGLYADFRESFGWMAQGDDLSFQERSIAFCFMAAMVEAGDA